MKFGIFYELSVPRPWDGESERTVYMNALEQVRLADELGFDQVWAVERYPSPGLPKCLSLCGCLRLEVMPHFAGSN